MPTLTIDGKEVTVAAGATVLQACEVAGIEIPRFCYHERLSIAGNCRMCLVDMEKSPKPIASCAFPAGDGMVIHTNTEKVKKAREGVMEFLLINHPLDCPICDQGGECDLQDQAVAYGRGASRFEENKRAVKDKYMGPLIKTVMTRCIHCMRCVRFTDEIAGVETMGSLYRGEQTSVTTYLEQAIKSELSGNVVDLCPVGALTSAPYAFKARSWELKKTESIDVMDAVGSNIRVDARGNEVVRVLPRVHEDVNEEWISDKTRHAVDGLKKRRLDQPWVRVRGKLQPASWEEAFAAIRKAVNAAKGDVAGLAGDLADMESMYALKMLLKGLGSERRIECRVDGAALDASSRAAYLFNAGIAGIEQADYLLLVGANPRHEATMVNARIRKAQLENGLKVAAIGPEMDLAYRVEWLGDDLSILNEIASGAHPVAKAIKAAKAPMIVIGMGALRGANGAAVQNAARAAAVALGASFNVLHTAASRVGALDLGLVADGGADAVLKAKAVFNLGADETGGAGLADAFHIYLGTHGDRAVKTADVILPGAAYTEKSGTYVNLEGRVQRTAKAVFAPGDAREDWTILRALADVLGVALGFDSLDELRARLPVTALDVKPEEALSAPEGGGKVASCPISYAVTVEDYYLTNPVARASATMNECADFAQNGAVEGTGTHG